MYAIEYQDVRTGDEAWHRGNERYLSAPEASSAISGMIRLGGEWASRAYRVVPAYPRAPTHPELAQIAAQLRHKGASFAFWADDDGAEALIIDNEIMAALPNGPVRQGMHTGGPIEAAIRRLLAWDVAMRQRLAAALERSRAAAAELEQAEALERERKAAEERERAEQERARIEAQARADAAELERVEALDRERKATEERGRQRVAEERERQRVEHEQRAAEERQRIERQRAAPAPTIRTAWPKGRSGDLTLLARLLRCGPWSTAKRAGALLSAEDLPVGAREALRSFARRGSARSLGNSLKRFADVRVDGIPMRLVRRIDGHRYARWQVISDRGETQGGAASGPARSE